MSDLSSVKPGDVVDVYRDGVFLNSRSVTAVSTATLTDSLESRWTRATGRLEDYPSRDVYECRPHEEFRR